MQISIRAIVATQLKRDMIKITVAATVTVTNTKS